jgi:hypothetical protein
MIGGTERTIIGLGRTPAGLFGGQTRTLKYLCLSRIHIDWNATPMSNWHMTSLQHPCHTNPLNLAEDSYLDKCAILCNISKIKVIASDGA